MGCCQAATRPRFRNRALIAVQDGQGEAEPKAPLAVPGELRVPGIARAEVQAGPLAGCEKLAACAWRPAFGEEWVPGVVQCQGPECEGVLESLFDATERLLRLYPGAEPIPLSRDECNPGLGQVQRLARPCLHLRRGGGKLPAQAAL